jgi:hypothetical protein
MYLHDPDRGRRAATQHYFRLLVLLLLTQVLLSQPATPQAANTPPAGNTAPLTAEQVVHKLVQMNLHRAESLSRFQGTRIYRAEYRGFGGTRAAEMLVSVKFLSPATKEFTILSATGSKLIIDRVFKKLLEAEKEALDPEMQRRSALTEQNYHFSLIGYETDSSGSKYVLQVEPHDNDKFLYRGRIWVDAEDFAVTRLEAEPARNPSFWTKKSEVVQEYRKISNFWLPAHNQSVSAIRLGGHAELTIEYKNYEVTGATQASSTPVLTAPLTDTSRMRK